MRRLALVPVLLASCVTPRVTGGPTPDDRHEVVTVATRTPTGVPASAPPSEAVATESVSEAPPPGGDDAAPADEEDSSDSSWTSWLPWNRKEPVEAPPPVETAPWKPAPPKVAKNEDLRALIDPDIDNRRRDPPPDPGAQETAPFLVNPTYETALAPLSTFSIDTDSASYHRARALLESGVLPPPQGVRVEEFVNAMSYGLPDAPGVFAVHSELSRSPFRPGYDVLRISLKAQRPDSDQRRPANLVLLVDVSGSMDEGDRLGLVKRSIRELLKSLSRRDRVALVTYSDSASVVLDPTPGSNEALVQVALAGLRTDGGTNVEAGLVAAYGLAAKLTSPGSVTRVMLFTDGVSNIGETNADRLAAAVREIAPDALLTAVGVGLGGYNDLLLERLAQHANGSYAYVDDFEAARKLLRRDLAGTLDVVARDVKVQVEFDPAVVERYRLLGYESRMLEAKDFRNDAVDAGEIGPGHTVTALYELKLRGSARPPATLHLRFKDRDGHGPIALDQPLIGAHSPAGPSAASQLALVSAAFAEKLRGGFWSRTSTYSELLGVLDTIPEGSRTEDVRTLGLLIEQAARLDDRGDPWATLAPRETMDFDRLPGSH